MKEESPVKSRRQEKILEIIRTNAIDTQEELMLLLRKSGFDVTQATISRDIKQLRLVKVQGGGGKYHYTTEKRGGEGMSTKFHSLFADAVVHIDYAGHMVVIKCMPGTAGAVCAAMDSLHWGSIVGTLAGDDTIFCIVRTEELASELVQDLQKML